MNQILAILEKKKLITHEEAEALAEYFSHAPQATHYKDALYDINKVLESVQPK